MTPETSHLERLEAVCRKAETYCEDDSYVDACMEIAKHETMEGCREPMAWATKHLHLLFRQKCIIDCAAEMKSLEIALTKGSGTYHLPQSFEELKKHDPESTVNEAIVYSRIYLQKTLKQRLHKKDLEQAKTLVEGWHAARSLREKLRLPQVQLDIERALLKEHPQAELLQKHLQTLDHLEAMTDYKHMSVFLEDDDDAHGIGQLIVAKNTAEVEDALQATLRRMPPSWRLRQASLHYVEKSALNKAKNIKCSMIEAYASYYTNFKGKPPDGNSNRELVFPFVYHAIAAAIGKENLQTENLKPGQLAD